MNSVHDAPQNVPEMSPDLLITEGTWGCSFSFRQRPRSAPLERRGLGLLRSTYCVRDGEPAGGRVPEAAWWWAAWVWAAAGTQGPLREVPVGTETKGRKGRGLLPDERGEHRGCRAHVRLEELPSLLTSVSHCPSNTWAESGLKPNEGSKD